RGGRAPAQPAVRGDLELRPAIRYRCRQVSRPQPVNRTAPRSASAAEARVVLRKGRARPLWYGHPWVYANAIASVEGDPAPGDVVSLTDHDGRFIGKGFYNARSQIPVRLCTRADEPVDAAFRRRRIVEARAVRTRLGLPSPETDVYRLVNSEGDDLPGLVVDIY